MKTSTIETLIELTSQFYSTQAQSFSATRHSGWEGWERVMQAVQIQLADDTSSSKETYSILDLAAGNLRFEHVIAGKFPNLWMRQPLGQLTFYIWREYHHPP